MGMTITEKILAAHAGRKQVAPGEIINCRVDVALGNDITAPLAIQAFGEMGAASVFDKDKVILVPDHFTPNKDIQSAEQCRLMREFAQEQGLAHYLEVGRMGIEHALLPEMGLVGPGDLDHRGRQPHLYLRRPRRLCHRRGEHGSGRGHGHGRDLAPGPGVDEVHLHGKAPAVGRRQGPHPLYHRRTSG